MAFPVAALAIPAVAGAMGSRKSAKKAEAEAKKPQETWEHLFAHPEFEDELAGMDDIARQYLEKNPGIRGSEEANPDFFAQPPRRGGGRGGAGRPGGGGGTGGAGGGGLDLEGRLSNITGGADAGSLRGVADEFGDFSGLDDIDSDLEGMDDLFGRIRGFDPSTDASGALDDFDLSGFDFSGGEGGWEEDLMRGGMERIMSADQLDPANDPTLRPYLDSLRRENEETTRFNVEDIGDGFDEGNMFGTSLRALESARVRDDAAENLENSMATTLFNTRQAALDRQLAGSGLLSGRDLDLRGLRQRGETTAAELGLARAQGIDELDLTRDLGERELELGALGLEGELGIDRAGARAELEGLRQSGLGGQADIFGGLLDAELGGLGTIAGLRQARMSANASRYGDSEATKRAMMADRLQRDVFNAEADDDQLAQYWDMIMGPASTFGQRYQKRLGYKDPGPDPDGAALLGGISGFFGGAGTGLFGGG